MTVGELRKKLEGIDPQIKVVVEWEIDSEATYFDALDASLPNNNCHNYDYCRAHGLILHMILP
jgi:hypothetical protein